MTNKFITCTECPNGCQLEVLTDGEKIEKITGYLCPRGRVYAENEIVDPRRIVTSTARTTTGGLVSVKTAAPVRKKNIFAVMERINQLILPLPVEVGDVLVENIDEDIPLIATSACRL